MITRRHVEQVTIGWAADMYRLWLLSGGDCTLDYQMINLGNGVWAMQNA